MMRDGDWIQTYSGVQFWPLDPRADEVKIDDIAHGLANICRFNGHCRVFYSVAEHSVRVSEIVPAPFQLAALFHDAAECYIGDIVRPVKRSLDTALIEYAILAVIAQKVGFAVPLHPAIKHADNVLLATEARDLMSRAPNAWAPMPPPLDETITPWSPAQAKERFFRRHAVIRMDRRL